MENLFGLLIREKRTEKQISLRGFSRIIGISPVYLSRIENGSRSAPSDDVIEKMAKALAFNEKERELMYDLAAQSKNSLSLASDLVIYINKNEIIHKALRLSKKCNAKEIDWQSFINLLSEKYL